MVPIHYAVLKNNVPMVKWLVQSAAEEFITREFRKLMGTQVVIETQEILTALGDQLLSKSVETEL